MILDSSYRNKLDFTFESLKRYEKTLKKIDISIKALNKIEKYEEKEDNLSRMNLKEKTESLLEEFKKAVNNDLDTHTSLSHFFAVLDLIDSRVNNGRVDRKEFETLRDAVAKMNDFLGVYVNYQIPQEIIDMTEKREALRKTRKFAEADGLRREIEEKGYSIIDLQDNFVLVKKYNE